VGVTKWEVVLYTLQCPNATKLFQMHNVHTVVTPHTASCLVLAILFQTWWLWLHAESQPAWLPECNVTPVGHFYTTCTSSGLSCAVPLHFSITFPIEHIWRALQLKWNLLTFLTSTVTTILFHLILKSYTTQKRRSSFKKLIFISNRLFCYNLRHKNSQQRFNSKLIIKIKTSEQSNLSYVICIFQWQMQSGGIVPFQSTKCNGVELLWYFILITSLGHHQDT